MKGTLKNIIVIKLIFISTVNTPVSVCVPQWGRAVSVCPSVGSGCECVSLSGVGL